MLILMSLLHVLLFPGRGCIDLIIFNVVFIVFNILLIVGIAKVGAVIVTMLRIFLYLLLATRLAPAPCIIAHVPY